MATILVADDEQRISRFVSKGLKAAGYQTEVVNDGAMALAYGVGGDFDLIILDINMPEIDGFEVLRRLRRNGVETPVIILTSRNQIDDTLSGLEGGADDYMAKPFRFEELLARVKLRLRAVHHEPEVSVLTSGNVQLDRLSRKCTVGTREVDLSTREYDLLLAFLEHPGQVLSRELLLSRVWDIDFDPDSNVVDVYVGYLRKKVGTKRIATVRGIGFRWEAEASPSDQFAASSLGLRN